MAKRIPKQEIIQKDKPNPSRMRECPQCSATGKINGKTCIACDGLGTRRQA